MNKKLIILMLGIITMQPAHALIVSVRGVGEVDEQGVDLTIDEAELDPLTDKHIMTLQGDLLAEGSSLSVRIYRSEENLTDEFCCGSQCTAGNGLTEEQKAFEVSGAAQWYTHYTPAPGSDVTIRYVFDDGTEQRELRVRYIFTTDATELLTQQQASQKRLNNGRVQVRSNDRWYDVQGAEVK